MCIQLYYVKSRRGSLPPNRKNSPLTYDGVNIYLKMVLFANELNDI